MYESALCDGRSWSGLILRPTLGIVMFPHGAQKLLGWFGGFGFDGTMGFFYAKNGIALDDRVSSDHGRVFRQPGAFGGVLDAIHRRKLHCHHARAVLTVHLPVGFFMNWFGQQQGEGYEYHLLVIGLAAALLVTGAGRWSADKIVAERLG